MSRIGFAVVLFLSLPLASNASEHQAGWLPEPVTDVVIGESENPALLPVLQSQLAVSMTPGEYKSAGFLVYAADTLADVLPAATGLRAGDTELASELIDIRVLKHWYQGARGARKAAVKPRIVPELLLKDAGLVKVEDGRNYLRLEGGEYLDISKRGVSTRRMSVPVDKMPVNDATELQPVSIPDGENRQFWVTIHIPVNTAPGIYTAEVAVSAAGERIAALPVEVEVLPFTLADPMLVYSIFHRAMLDDRNPAGSVSSELRSEAQYAAELKNMIEHGITQPNLYQKYSSPSFKTALKLRRDAGVNQEELFLIGLPAVPGSKTPVPFGFENWVRDTQRTVKRFGVKQLYLWGRDEAKAEKLKEQEPVWDFARELGTKIFAAGYHSTGSTGPGNFELMGPYHDTFVAINPVSSEEAARWHGIGKRIFSYQNPTGGMERPGSFRQNLGLLLWQHNYDGVMPYAYQDSFGNGWNDFDHRIYRDHNFVYPTVNGVVDTAQWEGVREAVNDIRYLSTLKSAMAASNDNALIEEIEAWLTELKATPIARVDLDYVRERMAGYVLALKRLPDDGELSMSTPRIISMNGISHIEWETSARAAARVEYGRSADSLTQTASVGAWSRTHRVALPENGTLYYQAVAVRDGEERRSAVQELVPGQFSASVKRAEGLDALTVTAAAGTLVGVDDGSLLGWWRFSESAGDESPNLRGPAGEAELTGDARRAPGYIGGGIELDGNGDFAYVSDIETGDGEPVTIEAWVKFNRFALERGSRQGIFTGLYQHQVNNHFYVHNSKALFEVSSLLRKGAWHHIVLTYAGKASGAIVYVDGQKVPVSAYDEKEMIDGLDGLGIGRSSSFFGGVLSGGTTQLDGAVDEVRVWNRRLSDAEVKASYGLGRGSSVLHYPAQPGKTYTVLGLDQNEKTAEVSAVSPR